MSPILWVSFLLFSVLLIVFMTIAQNTQMNRQYRQSQESKLSEAGTLLKIYFEDKVDRPELNELLLSVTNRYAVSVYLFYTKGDDLFIYPQVPIPTDQYVGIYEMVDEQFKAIDESAKSRVRITFSAKDYAGYATLVTFDERECYLFLSASFEQFNGAMRETLWLSIITALFAVVLSFVIGGFVSMVITKPVTDVTERAKQLARGEYEVRSKGYFCTELNELSKALDYASEEISKADRMQKELIANVSHDFKTPLTMIKAYASMIREISGDDPEKRNRHTEIIIDETDRLAALVGDVLDLSRLQAGIDVSEPTVFNLSEDVWRVAGRFDYLHEIQGYDFEIEVEDDLYAYAERNRTEQVLYNLIGNAVNYTGDDKKVIIRLFKQKSWIRFEVQDTGRGIPPEELDTIWERYYRSSESHKRPVKGTGLGLAIVKGVLKKQGIPFGADSEVGKGSCFWVNFPGPPDAGERES